MPNDVNSETQTSHSLNVGLKAKIDKTLSECSIEIMNHLNEASASSLGAAGPDRDAPAYLDSKIFELRSPSNQTGIDVFRGNWASDLSSLLGVNGTGPSPLFTQDGRPKAFADAFGNGGSLSGMNILELGPLEGGHTYMLEQLGASNVTAVESNIVSWLKCLVIKELLELQRSKFLLGDVLAYLSVCDTRYDAVMASGILYHMADPVTLIERISNICDIGRMTTVVAIISVATLPRLLGWRGSRSLMHSKNMGSRGLNYFRRTWITLMGHRSVSPLDGKSTAISVFGQD